MKKFTMAIMLLMLSTTVSADMDEVTVKLCSKIKTCSLAEIEKQNLPEEMATMMTSMFDGMCQTWVKPYAQTLGNAGLEKKAEACIDSMVSQSCQALMEAEGEFTSAECEEFQKAADKAGVDLEG